MLGRRLVAFTLPLALLLGTLFVPQPMQAAAPPALSLPIPAGETWKVIQGYNCGTHTNYDDNAFDLVNTNGRTRGAPVRAAADGTLWWAGGVNNVIILAHEGGYYTMYSHLDTRVPLRKGQFVPRGTVIGTVGSAGLSYSNPHLHFEIFHGDGVSASNRYGVPLKFIDGYDFPDSEQCNQYMGARMTAKFDVAAKSALAAPTLVDPGQGANQIVRWAAPAAADIKGYQVYVGADPQGTGEWFVAEPQVALPTLAPGRYYVRVRTLDNAGNVSEWATLLEVNL